MRSRSPTRKTESGGVFFWRINQAQYSGAGACAEKIVLSVLEKFGLCRSSEAAGSRLIWANCFEPKLWTTAGHCLINHFPRSVELTHKHRLCETLTRCRSRYLPRSFVLPQEEALWHQGLQDMRPGDAGVFGRHWIMKPGRGGGGRGVQVLSCQSAADIQQAIAIVKSSSSAKTPLVVSQYVEKPLLINGKKCDLRLYVLVTSFGRIGGAHEASAPSAGEECQADTAGDLTAYIFSEGLVRFASEPFAMSCESLGNSCIHLTNNEVNARHAHGPCLGNWRLSDLFAWLRAHPEPWMRDSSEVWHRIRALAWEVLVAARPSIAHATAQQPEARGQCFELFGFDVLLDEQLQPWLCEVNGMPSLGVGGKVDLRVDTEMLTAMFATVLDRVPKDRQEEDAATFELLTAPSAT
ncbi:TTLL5 [Symbiodinium microadriaticum]|nr:TTLL5 [Symbiodinium microadriaticum]